MSSSAADKSYTDLLYHFTKNNNGVPIYPYVTAVTGHRSFAKPGEVEGIPGFTEEDIKETFKSQLRPMAELWRKCCGKTSAPFILLTGMADGADQIAAEAALELDPELNIKIVAVLPIPEHLFINTVDDKDRYNILMEKVSYKMVIPLPPNNIDHEAELGQMSVETEEYRKEQYIAQSRFLAMHSHVLFAFWDGIPSPHFLNTTAGAVFYKLNGIIKDNNTGIQDLGDILTFNSVGSVVQLLLPRNNVDNRTYPLNPDLDMSSIPVFYLTRDILNECRIERMRNNVSGSEENVTLDFRKTILSPELLCNTAVAEIPEVQSVLETIGALNIDSVSNFKDKSFIKKCEQSIKYLYDLQDWSDFDRKLFQNKFDNLTPIEDRNTRILAEYFSIADQIAMKYQTITRKMFFRYSLVYSLLSIIVFYLSFYNWGKNLKSIFTWVNGSEQSLMQISARMFSPSMFLICSILLSCIFCIVFCIRRHSFHERFHRFRALAEILRIQIFWRISGINDCVSGYYRSQQNQETEWIRTMIYGLDAILTPPYESGFEAQQDKRTQFTIEKWVVNHRNYFLRHVKKEIKNKKLKKQKGRETIFSNQYVWSFLSMSILALPIKNIFKELALYFKLDQYISNIHSGLLGLIIAYASIWIKASRSIKADTKIHFEQMFIQFDRAVILLNSSQPVEVQQLILRQLGMIAISENINWLLSNGKQDLNLPR